MKTPKYVIQKFLLMVILLCTIFSAGIVSHAASVKIKVPSKVRTWVQSVDSNAIELTYSEPGCYIGNLKTSSKNLLAKWTEHTEYSGQILSDFNTNGDSISLFAKKEGTYKVRFTVYSKNGKKLGKYTVTVYAKTDSPVKNATFRGQSILYGITSAKSGKFKVVMNKGYKLKKIEYNTVSLKKDDNGNWNTTTKWRRIKNNQKIVLNTVSSTCLSRKDSYESELTKYLNYRWNDPMDASTTIRVTYIDKYTKKKDIRYYSLTRLVSGQTAMN